MQMHTFVFINRIMHFCAVVNAKSCLLIMCHNIIFLFSFCSLLVAFTGYFGGNLIYFITEAACSVTSQ